MERVNHRIYSVLLGLLLLLVACQEENPGGMNACEFDQQAMLKKLGEQLVVPAFGDLKVATDSLQQAALAFTTAPSPEGLADLKTHWEAAYLAYQAISVYDFGPGMTVFENGDAEYTLRKRFNTFPTNPEAVIRNAEAGELEIDNLFKSQVGFPALELLLFGEPGSSADDQLARYTVAPQAENYRKHLLAQAEVIAQKATVMHADWQNGYVEVFSENTGSQAGSSLSLLVNAFNFDFELLKNFKFRLPLGKFGDGTPEPQKSEGYYAGIGLKLAKAQAESHYAIYQAAFEGYLRCLQSGKESGTLLADDIKSQFELILQKMSELNDPFAETLVNRQSEVDALYLEMQKMVPLLKREMTSAFGVKISYQDNDGD